ncbi:DUF6881 domain-containing protein [Kosakonia sp. AX9b]
MTYIKVFWLHENDQYPIEIYSELDGSRYEVKKVEIFRDHKVGYATENYSYGKTMLGECPLPSLAEINSDPQFKAKDISEKEFITIWDKYVQS